MAKKTKPDDTLETWLREVKTYEREFKRWGERCDKINKRYRDDSRINRSGQVSAKMNMLWSNVQTLVPATFSRTPQPDVSRRFRDNDPVGRVASLILERGLEFEIQHYGDFRAGLKACTQDRFLGGRGTAWVRYEPHFKGADDGAQITEDTEIGEEAGEVLDYECAPVDYVHPKDFGHSVARTWEEVTKVWRRVYMGRPALVERFGADLGNKIPLDTCPEELKKSGKSFETEKFQAAIYEGWDKEKKKAYWFAKTMPEILDTRDDPLGLDSFFPCPRPLYATITTESLVPVPDFTLYQDQANMLDVLCDRIEGLIDALRVRGVYNSAIPELARLFTEGTNNTLIPVKDWLAFAEKAGLKGAIDLVELQPIFQALIAAYQAVEQVKSQIYEITGIADIVRGDTQASETATAQQIKGQYVGLRLRTMQQDVAVFATELLRLKAQILCTHFRPETLLQIGAVEQLSEADKQLIPQALDLLKQNTLREFRVDVEADSLVQIDENQEKQDRVSFLQAVGQFLKEAVPAGQATPQLVPLLMDLMKFGVTGFKVGRTIEGQFDQAMDQLKQAAANPQPKSDPEAAKAQAQMHAETQKTQREQMARQADLQREQLQKQHEAQMAQIEASHKEQLDGQQKAHDQAIRDMELKAERSFQEWKVKEDNATKITVAEIQAKATVDKSLMAAEQAANAEVNEDLSDGGAEQAAAQTKRRAKPIDRIAEMHGQAMQAHQQTAQTLAQLAQALSKPKKVIRGPDGRVAGIQ